MAGPSSHKCIKNDCLKRLSSPQAKYCSNGHRQTDIKNEERHTDDDDSDDDLLISMDGTTFTSLFPTRDVKQLRDQAETLDAKKKIRDAVKGTHGIRPSNAPPKTLVSIWFCETPPAKPINANILAKVNLALETSLESAADVHKFISENIIGENMIPSLMEHKDLASGELVVDRERSAWIGCLEGKDLVFEDVSGTGVTLGSVLEEITNRNGIKASLPLCIPVKREVKELVEVPSKTKKGHERGASMPNMAPTTSKKSKKSQLVEKRGKGVVVKEEVIKKEDVKKEGIKKEDVEEETNTLVEVKEESKEGIAESSDEDEFPDFSNLGVVSKTTRGKRVINKPLKYRE